MNGAWGSQDLTAMLGGPAVAADSGLASVVDTIANAFRIDFVAADSHVHEFFIQNGAWGPAEDLTASWGGPLVAPGSSLTAIVDTITNTFRIDYVGADSHLHEFYISNWAWGSQDLTAIAGGPAMAADSGLASVVDTIYNVFRIDYVGSDSHLHEFYIGSGSSQWGSQDLTAILGGPAVAAGSISGQVTAGGSGLSGVTVSLTGTTAAGAGVSESATTNSNGNYSLAVPAGGSYTVTPSLAGYTFSPAPQTFSNINQSQTATTATAPPASCSGVSPGWLGSTATGPATFMPQVSLQNSSAGIDFLVYGENQTIGQATVISGSISSQSLGPIPIYEANIPSSQFTTLGSYTVAARIHGTADMCAPPAFFAIVTPTSQMPLPPGQTACNSIAGSWSDSVASSPATATWNLQQSGTSVSGTVNYSAGAGCGTITWNVTGQLGSSSSGAFSLNSTGNPSPAVDSCDDVAATSITAQVTLANSGKGCDSASTTEDHTYPPSIGWGTITWSGSWTSSASKPSGETSQFVMWDTNGYDTQARFNGILYTSPTSNTEQFSGRKVYESGAGASDGCWSLANSLSSEGSPTQPVVNTTLNSFWYVQNDSTYGTDLLGYDPSVARYYQQYVGSCSLAITQNMAISTDGQPLNYANNAIQFSITPAQVSVQRSNASVCETYPGKQACSGR